MFTTFTSLKINSIEHRDDRSEISDRGGSSLNSSAPSKASGHPLEQSLPPGSKATSSDNNNLRQRSPYRTRTKPEDMSTEQLKEEYNKLRRLGVRQGWISDAASRNQSGQPAGDAMVVNPVITSGEKVNDDEQRKVDSLYNKYDAIFPLV